MKIDSKLRRLISQAIDLHVHIGPEIIPRKFVSVEKLAMAEQGKIAGMALKNHFYPTQPLITAAEKCYGINFVGGVVLNNFQGGLNPEAIYANALISTAPTIVWLPTISAEQFLKESEFEIAPEWVNSNNFIARKASEVKPVKIDQKINKVLRAIKSTGAILATGHISWRQTKKVVQKASALGITKIVITHPIYQKINFPVSELKKLVTWGVKIEQCYSMYSIDQMPIRLIAAQIKAVGAKNCILSSDVGQVFSPLPSESLYIFAQLLMKEGIGFDELRTMLVTNPTDLIN